MTFSRARDVLTARGAAGSDGISEHDRAVVQIRIAAGSDVPTGMEGSVAYLEGTYTQVIADAFSAVRLVVEGDVAAVAAADPTLAGLAFDPDAVFLIGNSFGTNPSGVLLRVEPDLDAVVLNVPTTSYLEVLAGAARSRQLIEFGLPLCGIRGTFDEVSRRLLLEPMFDVIEWMLQGIDPRAIREFLETRLTLGRARLD
jgi:hypothetical protein